LVYGCRLTQFVYFPLLFWVFMKSPHDFVLFFAVITGAHFFPYGCLYRAKAYYIMAPVISVAMMMIGWMFADPYLWLLPLAMIIFLFVLIVWLSMDYKQKIQMIQQHD